MDQSKSHISQNPQCVKEFIRLKYQIYKCNQARKKLSIRQQQLKPLVNLYYKQHNLKSLNIVTNGDDTILYGSSGKLKLKEKTNLNYLTKDKLKMYTANYLKQFKPKSSMEECKMLAELQVEWIWKRRNKKKSFCFERVFDEEKLALQIQRRQKILAKQKHQIQESIKLVKKFKKITI
jgi:hypothetical protein